MKNDIFMYTLIAGLMLTFPVFASVGVATIKGTTEGSPISGEVNITEKDDGIEVEANVSGVPTPGKHGFHFHEVGICSDEGKAAGGHFNPENTEHGFLPKDGKSHAHAGDMGNITITPDGKGFLKEFLPGVYLTKTPSIGGRSVVLHEKEDDFSQPTGNAGGRVGCGVIELKEARADDATDPSKHVPEPPTTPTEKDPAQPQK
jgi:superoxide dismutase, Cu-Zn family